MNVGEMNAAGFGFGNMNAGKLNAAGFSLEKRNVYEINAAEVNADGVNCDETTNFAENPLIELNVGFFGRTH